jgi:hypothetical protein
MILLAFSRQMLAAVHRRGGACLPPRCNGISKFGLRMVLLVPCVAIAHHNNTMRRLPLRRLTAFLQLRAPRPRFPALTQTNT